ncbi:MAG: Uma2 family endonuclease [Chloroflexi bacterium CFX4]|nr:Uma2 family endonuclease [Chloroflexi bacterium CFX4]MDL1921111.1 Uma2 family endonuclease [Chloroflexi bacterium CFX3]
MRVQEKLMTAEVLWELPQKEGVRYELAEGVLIEIAGGTGGLPAILEARIARHLANFVEENGLGYVTGASDSYILTRDPDIVRIPNAAFVAKARMPKPIPEKFLSLAPDLAVEIVSPNDSALEMRQKVREYLKHGVRLVWVIYPDLQTVDTYTAHGTQTLSDDAVLEGGDVLPAFRLPLRVLFADLAA